MPAPVAYSSSSYLRRFPMYAVSLPISHLDAAPVIVVDEAIALAPRMASSMPAPGRRPGVLARRERGGRGSGGVASCFLDYGVIPNFVMGYIEK